MRHFKNDREQVIGRARETGLVGLVNSSIGSGSFRRTIGLVKKYNGFIHHSAGCSVSQLTPDEAEKIITLTRKYAKDLVAIGEVGLDYHWVKDTAGRKAQEPLFLKFIELAKELELPIVIHSRKSEAEASTILERQYDGNVLMHCFDGPPEVAKRVADNGWYITLPANYSKYRNRRAAAEILPLDQIMLETDGPYLSPTNERNEPANVIYGCKALAEHLGIPNEEVAEATTTNAIRFYRI
jgi:TatD DNase family protein